MSRGAFTYSLYRIGLFAVCFAVGALAGLPLLPLLLVALLVSGGLSWFLLRRQREQMAVAVERAVARGQARMAARTAAEDAYVDQLLAGSEASKPVGPAAPDGDQPAS
jgi:Protein of unknown function (DUF4229)